MALTNLLNRGNTHPHGAMMQLGNTFGEGLFGRVERSREYGVNRL